MMFSTLIAVVGALVALALWTRYLERRESLRHAWRSELVSLRAAAWKADTIEELRQRLQRLELKGNR